MALVDDHVAVIADAVIHHTLSDQTLNQRHVELAVGFPLPAADAADGARRQSEKRGQPVDPLIEQLLSVDEHEGADPAFGDQPRGHHRLAERRRRRQHTGVVGQQCLGRGLLFRSQFTVERDIERLTSTSFVPNGQRDMQVVEQMSAVRQAAAWESKVMGMLLGTGDDPRLVVGWQSHRLGLVELGILKGGDADQAVPKAWRESVSWDVDLVSKNDLEGRGKIADDGRLLWPA